jgi:hypothetical protein
MKVGISGVNIDFNCINRTFFETRLAEYFCDFEGSPNMILSSVINNKLVPPKGSPVKSYRDSALYRADGEYYSRIFYSPNRIVYSTSDYSDVLIELCESFTGPFSFPEREYIATSEAFNNRLSFLNGIMLHSSAITYKGRALCFSAICGTGKSTHASLWKKCYGEDVEYINDDKPSIVLNDGNNPNSCGNPWSGKTDINHNICAPLAALVFLSRASENCVKRLSPDKAYYFLVNNSFRPYYDPAVGENSLAVSAKLVEIVPAYMLMCTPNESAVREIKKILDEDEVL